MVICNFNQAIFLLQHIHTMIKNKGPHLMKIPSFNDDAPAVSIANVKLNSPPNYNLGDKVATRLAYGNALYKLALGNKRVIALDGDTKNSTFSCKIMEVTQSLICCLIILKFN